MMGAAWTIASKVLKQRLRDRSAIIVGVIAPLALAAIFSFVFNPIEDFEFAADYVVVDQDGGPAARLFVDQVLMSMAADDTITVEELDTVEAARVLVDAVSDGQRGGTGKTCRWELAAQLAANNSAPSLISAELSARSQPVVRAASATSSNACVLIVQPSSMGSE